MGCYSDDTQLRLATCRAIRSDGYFDVDAFAKVELPIWRAYALGAGVGTKAAADALRKQTVQWSGNFFDNRASRYVDGGGNGAAMRIQPHVFAARLGQRDSDVVRDIIRNSVTTHGHPRGILGAVFHGLCMLHAIREGGVPGFHEWREMIEKLRYTAKILRSDDSLDALWLPCWEQITGTEFEAAVSVTVREIEKDIETVRAVMEGNRDSEKYGTAARAIGATSQEGRGSGAKCAVLSSNLAWEFRSDAAAGLRVAANALDTDTDTIATMAGAILGACCDVDPPEKVLDTEYMEQQATRLYEVSVGSAKESFRYPDLIQWQPPSADIDVARQVNGQWQVNGLGAASPSTANYENGPEKNGRQWQWFRLHFGQHVLLPIRIPVTDAKEDNGVLFPDTPRPARDVVAEAFEIAARRKFDSRIIGELVVQLSAHDANGEAVVQFARAVATTLFNQSRQNGKRD